MSSPRHEDAPRSGEGAPASGAWRVALGYLNFSSGAADSAFLKALDALFELVAVEAPDQTPGRRPIVDRLLERLGEELSLLERQGGAFADATQARGVLRLAVEFRTSYGDFHRDLVWGLDEDALWRPLFLGRSFEAILSQGPPWDRPGLVEAARDRFDDYLGYRPIAVLETNQKLEPYRHEWLRPIPLYVESAGVASGPYRELVGLALETLHACDPDLLRAAWFDPTLVEELAVDPRAYDFDHPVHKRPNHHFGQWDPNRIDASGNFRRFVLQPIVLEALLARVDDESSARSDGSFTRDELLREAAAVLAGTILMSSGVSGSGPTAHSGEETLATLLPQIAAYRDRFYEQLLERWQGPHADRLRAEAQRLRQPLAGARQHLNQEIARRRARQLQQVHLARVYARMGYADAALEEARAVRVASARILCELYCQLTAGHQALDTRGLAAVAQALPETLALVKRGIACGALVDPWNVIGFGGNFSLFPAVENTVHDYRVDDLVQLVEQVLGLASRAWTEAAAIDDAEREKVFSGFLEETAHWWDQFATPMVSGVRRLYGKEVEVSTNLVAGALNAWYKAGAASGDVGFWGMFVDQFDAPKAFHLVIEALLEKGDLVASMALLMRWLCQVELTPLEDGDASFHPLAERWLRLVEARQLETGEYQWPLVAKFFDHLEANAEELWNAPRFEIGYVRDFDDPLADLLGDDLSEDDLFDDEFDEEDEDDELLFGDEEDEDDEEDDGLDLFGAAYDGVTFEDSADDGMESAIFERPPDGTRVELEAEAQRLEARMAFLKTLARLWKHAAIAWGVTTDSSADERRHGLAAWRRAAHERRHQLGQLLDAVHKHKLPQPRGDHDSMIDYDRQRALKEAVVEGTIETCVEMADAVRLLRAAVGAIALDEPPQPGDAPRDDDPLTTVGGATGVLRALLRGDAAGVAQHWASLTKALVAEELLYVPLGKGGDPKKIVRARTLLRLISDLVGWLPRLGCVRQTCELLDVAQRMEHEHPVGRGAVTEYDRLFEAGYQAIVRCLVASADEWDPSAWRLPEGVIADADSDLHARPSDGLLVEALQELTESQLQRWLHHSRTVRLSVVERLASPHDWEHFVRFVQAYGADLFTQRFLTLSNLRAILHQRVGAWLETLREEDSEDAPQLVSELDVSIPLDDAARQLAMAIEAVVENYREYRDYNATTTQSDHGEMLHALVDFLRLRNAYDRVAWNLKPVYLAHKILVRGGRPAAAALWRSAVAERTLEAADSHQAGLVDLCERYGMRLPTVAERLAERFVRPLTIDRLRALVGAAMSPDASAAQGAFLAIRQEVEDLAETPCGAGLDTPDWIVALEEEVTSERRQRRHHGGHDSSLLRFDQVRLPWEDVQRQLAADRPAQGLPSPPAADE
ncbi:MAG: hypothetical protein ACRCT8_12865 [Lacipirellulaceae bacterium]